MPRWPYSRVRPAPDAFVQSKCLAQMEDKDAFLLDYASALALRLLYAKQKQSLAQELGFLRTLSGSAPSEHTGRMMRMVRDIQASGDPTDAFVILTNFCWPAFHDPNPEAIQKYPELLSACQALESRFQGEHEGKRLVWAHPLSRRTQRTPPCAVVTCIVVLSYNSASGKAYELHVSFAQFQVLTAYQTRTEHAFISLAKGLGMGRKELYRHIKVRMVAADSALIWDAAAGPGGAAPVEGPGGAVLC